MKGGRPALGSATRSPHVLAIRAAYGAPRFYLPGEHPATYQLRWTRRRLRETAPSDSVTQMIEWIDGRLDAFEAGEDRAKAYAWEEIRDRTRQEAGRSVIVTDVSPTRPRRTR